MLQTVRRLNLNGMRFGRLTAIHLVDRKRWRCICDCGNHRDVLVGQLRSGKTKSCGCLALEVAVAKGKATRRHGHCADGKSTSEYRTWDSMRRRCGDPTDKQWEHYGGRGITVCERWRDSFDNFVADMGRRPKGPPKHTLDRIDNDGNYEPGNCRWVTHKVQQNNKRSNRPITINGETMNLMEWLKRIGMSQRCFYNRTSHGMSAEDALTVPKHSRVRHA